MARRTLRPSAAATTIGRVIDVERARARFPALSRTLDGRPLVLFDAPAGTQTPIECGEAIAAYLARSNANSPHGAPFRLAPASVETGAVIAAARRAVADLLGATDPAEITFGASMTALAFAMSRRLAERLRPGDEIVVSPLDHAANILPWELAARERGAVVRRVAPSLPDCTVEPDAVSAVLSSRTKIVALGLASNAVGTVLAAERVAAIAAAVHRAGALLWIDAVHAAPHVPIDVAALDADFVACSAYKLYGPHVGILWGRRGVLEELPLQTIGWPSADLAGRFEQGTLPHELLAGLLGSLGYLASLGGSATVSRSALRRALEAIRAYEAALGTRLLSGLLELGCEVRGVADPARMAERCPTFGFRVPGRRSEEIVNALLDRGIVTWSGQFACYELMPLLGIDASGLVRAGIAHYNTAAEVDALLSGVRAARR